MLSLLLILSKFKITASQNSLENWKNLEKSQGNLSKVLENFEIDRIANKFTWNFFFNFRIFLEITSWNFLRVSAELSYVWKKIPRKLQMELSRKIRKFKKKSTGISRKLQFKFPGCTSTESFHLENLLRLLFIISTVLK